MKINKVMSGLIPPILLHAFHSAKWSLRRPSVKKRISRQKKLHLACGNNVLHGWSNVDFKSNGEVIGWDLTNPLPVLSETMDYIFCEHFIEHIPKNKAKQLIVECHRVLRAGGILRMSTPNLEKIVDEYLKGRTSEWNDVGWNPTTPCQLVNDGLRLWGHQFVYDTDELKHLFEEAGYSKIDLVAWHKSSTLDLQNLECRPFHGEVIFEVTK